MELTNSLETSVSSMSAGSVPFATEFAEMQDIEINFGREDIQIAPLSVTFSLSPISRLPVLTTATLNC